MKKTLGTIVFILATNVYADVETKSFDTNGIKGLKLTSPAGNVSISAADGKQMEIKADKEQFESGCTLTMDRTDSKIVVKVEKQGSISDNGCKVNFEIKVPKAIALDLKMGAGNIDIQGTKGKIEAKLGSGNLKADAEVDDLDATSGTGTVDVKGLTGDAEVDTGSGNVTLTYTSTVAKGEAEVKTGRGDATVFLPATMKIVADLKAGSGNISNEIGTSAEADFKVELRAGLGNLSVKKIH
jgi:hypothetical protein